MSLSEIPFTYSISFLETTPEKRNTKSITISFERAPGAVWLELAAGETSVRQIGDNSVCDDTLGRQKATISRKFNELIIINF